MNTENNLPDNTNDDKSSSSWFVRKVYESEAEKKRDFWLGFGGWFGLNILLEVIITVVGIAILSLSEILNSDASVMFSTVLSAAIRFLQLLLNIGVLIYFARTRLQAAAGMLTAISALLMLALFAGMAASVGCFVFNLQDPGGYAIVGQVIVAVGLVPVILVTAVVWWIVYYYSRSSHDPFLLRMTKVLGIMLAIVCGLGILLTIGYLIVQAVAS